MVCHFIIHLNRSMFPSPLIEGRFDCRFKSFNVSFHAYCFIFIYSERNLYFQLAIKALENRETILQICNSTAKKLDHPSFTRFKDRKNESTNVKQSIMMKCCVPNVQVGKIQVAERSIYSSQYAKAWARINDVLDHQRFARLSTEKNCFGF